jgi:choline dehydrogenase-like flavoprotein
VKRVLVVGSGAGGAAAARELQGEFRVTVLEAGGSSGLLPLACLHLKRSRKQGFFLTKEKYSCFSRQ